MDKIIEIQEFGIIILVNDGGGKIVEGFKPNARWRKDYVDGMMDGVESFLLSLACQGVDITSPEFVRALQATIDAIDNNS